jgi:hypothetical protein
VFVDNRIMIIAAVALCGIFTAVQFARRGRWFRELRRSVQRYASRHGFQFSATDPYRLTGSDLPLLQRGGKRKCSNVVSGQWEGLPFAAADYQYHEHESDARGAFRGYQHSYKYLAVVVANLDPRLRLPPTVIARRVVPTAFGDHLGLRQLVTGWELFDRRFQIEVGGGGLPPQIVNGPMLQHLLRSLANTSAFRWEIVGSRLLVASFPRHQPTEDMLMEHIEPLLVAAKGFADQLMTGTAR